MHLIIDGYGNDQKVLQDEKFLYQLLDTYPSKIGMTKITAPVVFRYVGTNPEDWGISGFVNIDVFSCKDFDAERVVEDLKSQFGLTRLRSYLLDRDWLNPSPFGSGEVVKLYGHER